MKNQTIVLRRSGTKAQIINIDDLVAPELPPSRIIDRGKHSFEIHRLLYDVLHLITALQSGSQLPEPVFIPDLWHTAMRMPSKEQKAVLELWHFAHMLVIHSVSLYFVDNLFRLWSSAGIFNIVCI
jgi:hypothetical protein